MFDTRNERAGNHGMKIMLGNHPQLARHPAGRRKSLRLQVTMVVAISLQWLQCIGKHMPIAEIG